MYIAEFIDTETIGPDLIITFSLLDESKTIIPLVLLRTPSEEKFLDDEDKGIQLALGIEQIQNNETQMLSQFHVSSKHLTLSTRDSDSYKINIATISAKDLEKSVTFFHKMNMDQCVEIMTTE